MLVHKARLGFATNSSSTHSIVFVKPSQKVTDDADAAGFDFGWSYFTAASEAAKRQYVAIHLHHALRSQVGDDIANAVCDAWTPGHVKGNESAPDGYVDHQSVYDLPTAWNGKGVDKEFFEEFRAFFMREDVVILGGNDNDDAEHPLAGDHDFVLPLPRDCRGGGLVARKDPQGNYWVVFDRVNGTKVRFSFEDPTSKRQIVKAFAPELVDVKITDQCPFGCAFCYQGSTHDGKHADYDAISKLAYTLGGMRVFEVAIGGGEPTLHPKFLEILSVFKHVGIVPNFTTKNLAWLRDPAVWPKVMELIGAFAFSVSDRDDVKKLAALLELNDIPTAKCNVQVVMGAQNMYQFEQIIREAVEADLRITLLGYKTTGRGGSFKPEPYKDWTKVIEKLHEEKHWFTLGIDTALAHESAKELARMKVSPKLYETKEGCFSMYADAVSRKLGPSSYVEDIAMKRVEHFTPEAISSAFAQWGKTSWEKLDALGDAE
jgi:hypothetical protein